MTANEYNTLVNTHSDRLLRYALKMAIDYSWAQDLVQESLIKLWSNRDKVTMDYAKPFLYRVLYNKMIDDIRKRKREHLTDTLPELTIQEDNLEAKDVLENAFAQLNDAQKQIIMLRDWEGYSYEEISEILELNLSLVKVNLFRARKKMRAILTELNNEMPNCYENQ